MKKALQLLAFAFFTACGSLYAQDAVMDTLQQTEPKEIEIFENHKVTLGETIIMVARKYTVSPQDIYEYNKDAIQGISAGQILFIPMHRSLKEKKKKAAAKQQDKSEYAEKSAQETITGP